VWTSRNLGADVGEDVNVVAKKNETASKPYKNPSGV